MFTLLYVTKNFLGIGTAALHTSESQWRRYAWQVLCPATDKIGPGARTCQ